MKYLLANSCDNSRTWSAHLRYLSLIYNLEDPLSCLGRDPPTKTEYKEIVNTKITAFYENLLRKSAVANSQMKYLNVSVLGLRGRHHPALASMVTSHEVRLSRPHIKFLTGNYLTYEIKAKQSGGSPRCRVCSTGENESVSHVISTCQGMSTERTKLLSELKILCTQTKNNIKFDEISENQEKLCQFILDPTSLNLSQRTPVRSSPI